MASCLGTWVFNNSISYYKYISYIIEFNIGSQSTEFPSCSEIHYYRSDISMGAALSYTPFGAPGETMVWTQKGSIYYPPGWQYDEYKTITITGGFDINNDDLYAFLVANTSVQPSTDYAITFKNDDNTVLQESIVTSGTSPEYTSTTPTKTSSVPGTTYTFAGWVDTLSNTYPVGMTLPVATQDMTYTAYYTSETITYTITFEVNGQIEQEQTINDATYGQSISYGGVTPSKFGYNFTGWVDGNNGPYPSNGLPNVTKDTTYIAQFEKIPTGDSFNNTRLRVINL